MKKLLTLMLALLMLGASVAIAAEPADLSTCTDEELEALRVQVAEEIRARRMAERQESPNDDFVFASNGKEVRINGYRGAGGDVCIPDEIDGVPVKQIYEEAFKGNRTITSVQLPSKLVGIGEYAFNSCRNLQQVLVLPKCVKSVESMAFGQTGLTGVVIQSHCALAGAAFRYSEGMQFCYIREGCRVSMESTTFGETGLEIAVIPASVTSIHKDAFHSCNKLTIYCPAGSYAEQFCRENFIACNTADYEAMVAYYEALYPAE